MNLSRLKELRPDVWEEAKMQALKLVGLQDWKQWVHEDTDLVFTFTWDSTDQKGDVWRRINDFEDFTLYDQWVTIEKKQPEPQCKIDLEYWRWEYAGRAMQSMINQYTSNDEHTIKIFSENSVAWADALIAELQKEKA